MWDVKSHIPSKEQHVFQLKSLGAIQLFSGRLLALGTHKDTDTKTNARTVTRSRYVYLFSGKQSAHETNNWAMFNLESANLP